ncbi:hypothetical protein GJAV_G00042830 [Gymnothorax javanicus]|nr:hypothetical protein GJAV_G00042830 [Gymnothorax javanicus]
MEEALQMKESELEQMRRKLKEQERLNQTEIIKLQMEFSAKLARAQTTSVKVQQQPVGIFPLPRDIYKRKLQFVQEERQREVEALRQRIFFTPRCAQWRHRAIERCLWFKGASECVDWWSSMKLEWTSRAVPEADKMTAVCMNTRPVLGESAQSSQGRTDHCTEEAGLPRPLTPLQRVNLAMCQDEKIIREVAVGRHLGLYKVRGEIGRGSFSRVKLGIHALTTDKVAIKVLEKGGLDQHTQRLLSREIESMDRLHHPNIIRLYEVLETPSRLHLVMEYAEGGELYTRVSMGGKLSDNECKIVFTQILSAVKHMHENSIVHRDLKAENVFYARGGCVKVGDFGFSTVCAPDQTLSTFCGSAPYAAPELFQEKHYAGEPVDVWALGVLLYFIVTGAMPFRADTVPRLKRCILGGVFVIPPFVPVPCQRLICGILRPLPTDRFTLDQMIGCEWLLPVTFPRPIRRFPLEPLFLAEDGELDEEQLEVRDALEELGITVEHILNNRGENQRRSLAGVYRIILHHVHKRRGLETPPTILLPVADPRKDWIWAYRHLHHTSKLCTIA